MILIFVPVMVVVVILLPINYSDGAFNNVYSIEGHKTTSNVTGLDTLSWQNVAPISTNRYWAHLICAVLAVSWALYRIYCEKVNFIDVRQQFLTSPEQRIKASARTILVTNIPAEFRTKEALEGLYDVFVDNDDRSKLTIWVNRDYSSLRALVAQRASLRHALEKEELSILQNVNKKYQKKEDHTTEEARQVSTQSSATEGNAEQSISTAFESDCSDSSQLWHRYIEHSSQITLIERGKDKWAPASTWKIWASGTKKKVPKIAWLRSEIARLTIQIDDFLPRLDDDETFPRQNSAFIQFDRQMAAHMACGLVSHHKFGRMTPRFVGIAPHEIVWPNMGVTSLWRLIRSLIALILFVAMLFLWGLPTTFLGVLSQLDSLRANTSWLAWLRPWPTWVISLISGTYLFSQ
jgi:calcium permeable stress-gated cation channel